LLIAREFHIDPAVVAKKPINVIYSLYESIAKIYGNSAPDERSHQTQQKHKTENWTESIDKLHSVDHTRIGMGDLGKYALFINGLKP